jgi:hypothetical protein
VGPLRGQHWHVGLAGDSFVKERSTTDARYDLQDFLQALVRRGHLNGRQYLSSVEAGTEVFTGAARPDTSAYSAGVG